jgi:hypothetical protein
VASLRQPVNPVQIFLFPEIAAGTGFTDIVVSATQPSGDIAMIVVVPLETPVTMPVDEPIVATEVLVLLQVTPAVASVNVMVLPTHTAGGPEIGAVALTVTVVETEQPLAL